MSRLADVFRGFRRAKPDAEAVERIKGWVQSALGDSSEVSIAVNEIACTDPACPGTETVILAMEPGRKTRAFKVGKPIEEVTEQDLRAALD
jgi:hypothetical protein